MEGVEIIRANIRDLDIRDAHKVDGRLRVVRYDAGDALQRWCDEQQRVFERDVRVLSRAQLRERLVTEAYFQGVDDPTSFHFHPLNYARALARSARLGVRIHEDTPAQQLALDGAVKQVATAGVEARTVVLATGGYTGALQPALTGHAAHRHLHHADRAAGRARARSHPQRRRHRRRPPRRQLLPCSMAGASAGAVESPPGSTTRPTWPRRCAANCCRFTRNCRACAWWSGRMAYARHLMPQIGLLAPDVWYCTAFGGHGMNTASIGGRVVAEGITGDSHRYQLFQPFGLAWNGGALGRAAVQLTYWSYQARDWWRERRSR